MFKLKAWISALRPRTLFLAVATTICGSGLAYYAGQFSWTVFALTMLTATLLQLLSNMANDLGDYEKGTDITGKRLGPTRTVQSGAISPQEMKRGILFAILLTMVVGASMVFIALQFLSFWYILAFLGLGAAAIWAAIKYTLGKNSYGYKGLGDLFSFIFFGPVPVVGTYFLHTQRLDILPWISPIGLSFFPWVAGIGLGLLSVAVLNINNMRDLENDKESGKRTIPVRIGFNASKLYHAMLNIAVFLCFFYYTPYLHTWFQYSYLLVFIAFGIILYKIITTTENKLLDPYLKFTSMCTFFLALAFSIFLNLPV